MTATITKIPEALVHLPEVPNHRPTGPNADFGLAWPTGHCLITRWAR